MTPFRSYSVVPVTRRRGSGAELKALVPTGKIPPRPPLGPAWRFFHDNQVPEPDNAEAMHNYSQVRFLTSAPGLSEAPPDRGREVAFAGRSNAGKSSVLNTLTGQRSLARTSKTPGRTQLINFFSITGTARLVDLPGYGYAQVPQRVKERWQRELAHYLEVRGSLQGLVLIMDVRHPLTDYDRQMLSWSEASKLPVHVLLNKCDKLKRGPAKSTLLRVEKAVSELNPQATIQLFSVPAGTGLNPLRQVLDKWLALSPRTKG